MGKKKEKPEKVDKKKSRKSSARDGEESSDDAAASDYISNDEEDDNNSRDAGEDMAVDSDGDDDDGSCSKRCKHAAKQSAKIVRDKLKLLPKLVEEARRTHEAALTDKKNTANKKLLAAQPLVCWICTTCGSECSSSIGTHFCNKHPIGIELVSRRWHCFICELDLSDSNTPTKGYAKVKQLNELIEKALGAASKRSASLTAAMERAKEAQEEAERAEKAAKESPTSLGADSTSGSNASTSTTTSVSLFAKGLRNTGNTCFFNSVLQCLASTAPLYGSLFYPSSPLYSSTAISPSFPIQSALFNFLQSMSKPVNLITVEPKKGKSGSNKTYEEGRVITPSTLLSAVSTLNPMFRGNRQHDSHELLRTILNGICLEKEEEVRKKKQAHANAVVKNLNADQVLKWVETWSLAAQDTLTTNILTDEENVWDGKFFLWLLENWAKPAGKKPRLRLHNGITTTEDKRLIIRQLQRLKDGELPAAFLTDAEGEKQPEISADEKPIHPLTSLLTSTFIHEVFGGVMRNTVECFECHTISTTHEFFMDLSLAIEAPRLPKLTSSHTPAARKSTSTGASASAISKHKAKHMTKAARKALKRKANKAAASKAKNGVDDDDNEEDGDDAEGSEDEAKAEGDEKTADSEEKKEGESDEKKEDGATTDSQEKPEASAEAGAAIEAAVADGSSTSAPTAEAVSSSLVDSIIGDSVSELTSEIGKLSVDEKSPAANAVPADNTTADASAATPASSAASENASASTSAVPPVTTITSPSTSSSTASAALEFLQYLRHMRLGFDRLQGAQSSIQDCIGAFTDPDLLTGSNKYGCKECSNRAQQAAAAAASVGTVSASVPSTPARPAVMEQAATEPAAPVTASEDSTIAEATSSPAASDEKSPETVASDSVPIASPTVTRNDSTESVNSASATGSTTTGDESAAIADDSLPSEVEPSPPPPPIWVKQDAMKRSQILVPPVVLTLHLKRFHQTSKSIEKSSKGVQFPLCFNLKPFMTPATSADQVQPFSTKDAKIQPTVAIDDCFYHLYGIVSHGGSLGSGHYVAYCRKQNMSVACEKVSNEAHASCECSDSANLTSNWYYFSDSDVKPVSFAEVLKVQAYILFYVKA